MSIFPLPNHADKPAFPRAGGWTRPRRFMAVVGEKVDDPKTIKPRATHPRWHSALTCGSVAAGEAVEDFGRGFELRQIDPLVARVRLGDVAWPEDDGWYPASGERGSIGSIGNRVNLVSARHRINH